VTRRRLTLAGLVLTFAIGSDAALGCTIFKVTRAGVTLVGNNEDGTDRVTYLWFVPASRGKYGRVYFTLSDKWPQGGMNERGLFYDGTAGPWKEVVKSAGKRDYRGNLSEKMLEECATVDEALALLQRYNLGYFRNGQMFLADRLGNSAIVEGDVVIRGRQNDQIATNFYHSNPAMGGFPCHRYDIAEAMIAGMRSPSADYVRAILQAVHLEGYSYTQYSTICDLTTLTIHYFKDSDFAKSVTIDLKAELRKGERWFDSTGFFERNPAARVPAARPVGLPRTVQSFFGDKALKSTLGFANDLLDGVSQGFHRNGRVAWRAAFDRGRIRGTLARWDESGRAVTAYEYLDANRTDVVDYFPGGVPLLRVTLDRVGVDGLAPGRIVVYNENGSVSYRGTFREGLLFLEEQNVPFTGRLSAAFRNGAPFSTTSYRGGKLHGELTRRDSAGRIREIEEYRDGVLVGVKRY